jgi:iron complex transport system substrate-binding protein
MTLRPSSPKGSEPLTEMTRRFEPVNGCRNGDLTSRQRRRTPGWTRFAMTVTLAAALMVVAGSRRAPDVAQPERPGRIVCLVPAVTEMLFAIGAGPQVMAVSSFDTYPPEVANLPRVGALLDPDLERILSLRPDLVVVYGTQVELRQQLDRAGVPQFVYTHARLADVMSTIRDLGTHVGRTEQAHRVAADIETALDDIRTRVADRRRPRTLLVIGREPGTLRGIIASGGYGFLHEMLEIAGGENVFGDVARESVQATSELVLARRPEVILEIRGSPVSDDRARAAWSALSSVPAVRTGRIHIIGDQRAVVPGPRIAEGTALFAQALHR